ncbi:uncharacterized protein SAPINGB_P005032 [Magnusiomyces paraingens]|uniref:Uncharacterized protein n=1 Tax=Magnusiomyces paraingens TaxID=2606893 RepID=A0A5E8C3M2_9ASCO|nr:uncharacterized protein SAPINGB_P005032 [Saprochaete ingens]VVT56388.1 unnamed protein product [Saprochaete ingens]
MTAVASNTQIQNIQTFAPLQDSETPLSNSLNGNQQPGKLSQEKPELTAPEPEHCPGTESELAGQADACQGCPNQEICASAPKGPDPDLPLIRERVKDIQHKVLVLSGKGGVGKSTFTSMLGWAFAADESLEVGIMDVDVCGPSMPQMMGVQGERVHQSGEGWTPVYVDDNLSVISIGFLLPDPDNAVIWRGPKKNGLIKQFLKDVVWGELDYLVVDTPPGTSDEHLSLNNYLKLENGESGVDGAIIVTTPQEVALLDVRKEIDFCRKANIRILGIVENMSGFVCPNCKGESFIFAPTTGGGEALAKELDIPFLGKVPLDPRIGKACDEGVNFLQEYPDSPACTAILDIIDKLRDEVEGSLEEDLSDD